MQQIYNFAGAGGSATNGMMVNVVVSTCTFCDLFLLNFPVELASRKESQYIILTTDMYFFCL